MINIIVFKVRLEPEGVERFEVPIEIFPPEGSQGLRPIYNTFVRWPQWSSVHCRDHRGTYVCTEDPQKGNWSSHLWHEPARSDIFRAVCPIAGEKSPSSSSPIYNLPDPASLWKLVWDRGKRAAWVPTQLQHLEGGHDNMIGNDSLWVSLSPTLQVTSS